MLHSRLRSAVFFFPGRQPNALAVREEPARTDVRNAQDEETYRTLMLLPAEVAEQRPQTQPPDLAPVREKEIAGRIEKVESRNARFFHEELIEAYWEKGVAAVRIRRPQGRGRQDH